jgi:acetyl esterase
VPLDWATIRILEKLSKVDDHLRHPKSVEDIRSLSQWIADDNGPGPSLDSVEDVTLRDNGVPTARLRVLTPRLQVPAVVVYFPGPAWGWVAGTLDSHDTVARKLAERTGCAFILVDHRRAPENPYPAAVDDAWQALLWAEQHRQQLPGPTPPLVIVGEGSGGALAALLSRRCSETGGPAIGSVVLISPCLDSRTTRRSYSRYGEDGLVDRALMDHIWDVYLPNALDRVSPDAMPLRARDFRRRPLTVLLTPEHDPLQDEGHEYLVRLASAGVPTERHVFPGQMHGFFGMLALPLGERAFQVIVRHVREYVAYAPAPVAA